MNKLSSVLSVFFICTIFMFKPTIAQVFIGDPGTVEKTMCSLNSKINNYCLTLSGKDLEAVSACVKEKIPGVTISNDLSSFTFSVQTTGGAKTYRVSLALDKMFCGVIDNMVVGSN